jgi:hypothetical protein
VVGATVVVGAVVVRAALVVVGAAVAGVTVVVERFWAFLEELDPHPAAAIIDKAKMTPAPRGLSCMPTSWHERNSRRRIGSPPAMHSSLGLAPSGSIGITEGDRELEVIGSADHGQVQAAAFTASPDGVEELIGVRNRVAVAADDQITPA